MRIAINGYGKMGKAIEAIAQKRNHEIVAKIDGQNKDQILNNTLKDIDVVIDFSIPTIAVDALSQFADLGIPCVSGTTGWLEKYDQVCEIFKANDGAFLYASNFSIGVNVFFDINERLAKLLGQNNSYRVAIEETHHIHKLDKPSGTGITLANQIIEYNPSLNDWNLKSNPPNSLHIDSIRSGEVFGIHQVAYQSPEDILTIRHEAKNRDGFALGAVIAAEWILNKKGIFSMKNVLQDL